MTGKTRFGLLAIALSLIFVSIVLTVIAADMFYSQCDILPTQSKIGPIDISGLTSAEISEKLNLLMNIPLEFHYGQNTFQELPTQLGIEIDPDNFNSTIQENASYQCETGQFIDFLFGKANPQPVQVDIRCKVDETKIRSFLENEIVPRYDVPAKSKQPSLTGSGFIAGSEGSELNLEEAVALIKESACLFEDRSIELPIEIIPEPEANLENLEILLSNVIDQNQDIGQITEIALIDPKTGESFDIARRDKNELTPEIAFTAASTIKVPVMISSFRRMDTAPNAVTQRQLELMITESKNDQTDWLMENIIGGDRAPTTVTNDLRELGLENTFLAGYFYLGAPLLDLVETPANSRTDIDLNPDIYNQTTAMDMAQLMQSLYLCEKILDNILFETFQNDVDQSECSIMIELLKNNHLPYLISAGVPEGTSVAHKHGWIEESDGLLHTMSNVAAVYTAGGDYILSVFTYHPQNLIFEDGNILFTRLSEMVYGYFNPVDNSKSAVD